jgi:hypothetical protein
MKDNRPAPIDQSNDAPEKLQIPRTKLQENPESQAPRGMAIGLAARDMIWIRNSLLLWSLGIGPLALAGARVVR